MPKPAITRVSSMLVDATYNDLNSHNNGFYAPRLTTAQIAAISASTLQNGAIVYNTTTNMFQVYQNGAWTNLTTSANLVVPVVANTGALPAAPVNGMIVYQTDIQAFKVYQNGAWVPLLVGGYHLVTGNGVNYTVLNSDTIIGVSTAHVHIITLPAIATAPIGKIFTIKDVTGSANAQNITIAADANIDGGAANAQNIAVAYGFINVFSNGTQWFILSKLIA